jgi:ankyrin repeat protein
MVIFFRPNQRTSGKAGRPGPEEVIMPRSYRAAPTRKLPEKPSFNQLKKQAKDLLKAFQAGDETAINEVRAFFPESGLRESRSLQLSDAQLVLARAYGFETWPKLKAFVDGITMNRFVAAVEAGEVERVATMLHQRPELARMDTAGDNELRGLHYAVMRRNARMVRVLMQAGANARQGVFPHRDATTAFTLARDREFKEIVNVIEEGEQHRREKMSCPNAAVSPVQDRINHAIRNGDQATAMRLLEADKSLIRACDRDGATPLHVAAQAVDGTTAAWLLARGANPNKRDVQGLTPMDRAALAAHPGNDAAQEFAAFAKLLLDRGAEITLPAAIALADAQRVRDLIAANPEVLRQVHWWRGGLLSLAVKHGHIEIVQLLLDLGADIDERTVLTELEEPTTSWGAPLWYAALAGRRDIAELLLDRGADPNANVYASGWPLSRALERNDEAMKRLLLERGAKLQPHMVAQAHDVAEARRMLQGEADEHVVQELTWSAADSGCPEIVQLALPRLHWPPQHPGWHWILIQPIRGLGTSTGAMPTATIESRLKCMEILLRHGINVNVARLGQTALHFAAARQGIENEADRVRFAALLLDCGARLDLRDDLLKSTPLGWACRWGRVELVELLIARGAPLNEIDAEPWATPLAWAKKMGNSEVERRLRDHGAH